MTSSDDKSLSDERRELTEMVGDLIAKMEAGSIRSLELEYGDLKLSLKAGYRPAAPQSTVEYTYTPAPQPLTAADAMAVADEPDGHVVTAPMIGTFYVAPAPNEPPFVTVGDHVTEGQTIGIIEAMKIMNEIASDREGTVLEILAGDGQTVEYGSQLVRIEPAGE